MKELKRRIYLILINDKANKSQTAMKINDKNDYHRKSNLREFYWHELSSFRKKP